MSYSASNRKSVVLVEEWLIRHSILVIVLVVGSLWGVITYANSNNDSLAEPKTAAQKCADAVPSGDTGAYEACLDHYARQAR